MDPEKDMQVPSINIHIPSPEPEEYRLGWGNHNSEVISAFHELFEMKQLTDVTLSTEDDQIQAHQLVLSACSPYFRTLFTTNDSKHPIIFLKEIPTEHIRLLLEYMYKGSIVIPRHELNRILATATSLKIRGLMSEDPKDCEKEKFQHIDTGSIGSTGSSKSSRSGSVDGICGSLSARSEKREGGRKSSNPKRLRLNTGVSADSGVSSPKNWMDYHPDPDRPLVISEPASVSPTNISEAPSVSPNTLRAVDIKNLMEVRQSSGNSSPLDDIAESEGEDQNLDPNQPVDFSKGDQLAPRFSILGNHLKNSGRNSKTPDHMKVEEPQRPGQDLMGMGVLTGTGLEDASRMNMNGGMNALAAAAMAMDPRFNRTQQKRPSSRGSKSPENLKKKAKTPSPNMQPLPSVPTLDMHEMLRNMANLAGVPNQFSPAGNLPSQLSAANLASQLSAANMANPLSAGNLASQLSAANLANLPSQLSASNFSWLNGVGGVASPGPSQSPSRRDSISENDAKPKNPIGGYKTGEIGANGKQPVACEVCGKKLTDPSSLYRHRKIHSGDKPHKCPYCNRRFIQRYNMKQHIKTHKMELMQDSSNWDLLPKNHDLGEMAEAHRLVAQGSGPRADMEAPLRLVNREDNVEAPIHLQNRADMLEARMNGAHNQDGQNREGSPDEHENELQIQENWDPKQQNQDDEDMDDQPLNMSGAQHDL